MPRSKQQKMSDKQEHQTAKDIGGRTTAASGAKWHSKGDVKSSLLLGECKATNEAYYSLNCKTWQKIAKEAAKSGYRIPFMRITTSEHDMALVDSFTAEANHMLPENMADVITWNGRISLRLRPVFSREYNAANRITFGPYFSLYAFRWDYFIDCAKEFGWIE